MRRPHQVRHGLLAALATAAVTATALAGTALVLPGSTGASTSTAPGTVLATRTLPYHVVGIATPLQVVQLTYATKDATGRPVRNVTSVIRPPVAAHPAKVVSYQSFYDSLNPADQPSTVIAGGGQLPGNGIPTVETALFLPLLLQGYTVVVPDTEGQRADFAAGPEYGTATLDSLRAVYRSAAAHVPTGTKAALYGYSGGAIATEWAAELAPTYAPDVDRHLVGAAMGGVLVDPIHNLHYVDGTSVWSGVLPMALIGLARAYHVDLSPYLSAYGRQVYAQLKHASIGDALGHYPGLTFAQLAKPRYAEPESIPVLVRIANKLIMSRRGTPSVPLFIAQGANGELEGTPGTKPGIGPGDGVMIAGDVRTLARRYCAAGVPVQYQQYDALSHVTTAAPWSASAVPWLEQRIDGAPATDNCASIAPGNPLTPVH